MALEAGLVHLDIAAPLYAAGARTASSKPAHVYDEEAANEIFEQIRAQFLPLLRQLEQTLSEK